LHWKTILFIEANAITGQSTYLWHIIFRVPAHRAKETVALLTTETPDFIPPTLWPPNSLDLNPVDYCVWTLECATTTCLPHQGGQCGQLETAHRGWMASSFYHSIIA